MSKMKTSTTNNLRSRLCEVKEPLVRKHVGEIFPMSMPRNSAYARERTRAYFKVVEV